MKKILAVLIILCMGYLIGCAKTAKRDVVAVVNGKKITMEMVDKRITNLPSYYQTFASQHKKEVVADMVIEELLYEEAKRRKLDRNPDVKEFIAEAERKILISRLIQDETQRSVPVSDDDVKKYYEENKNLYAVPEVVRASHILTNTEEEAKKAFEELKGGADFAEVAKKYSKDLTKDRGGDLGYFRKGQMIPEFEKACFNLKVGETSPVVKTRFGYHIIKLTDRKEPTYRPFDEVKENIRTVLSRERQRNKFDELTKRLKDKARVTINESIFTPTPAADKKVTPQAAAIPAEEKEEAETDVDRAQGNK